MSTFIYPAIVANPRGGSQSVEIKFLVDTGAAFTSLPAPQLKALGLTPAWRVPVTLADGHLEEWGATEVLLTIDARSLHTPCLFAPPGSLPLLGAVALEQFALAADPLNRILIPARVPMT